MTKTAAATKAAAAARLARAQSAPLPKGAPGAAGLGARLRQARIAAGISQETLAAQAGVSYTALRHLESAGCKRSQLIEQLAAALEVSPAWLAFGRPPGE